MLSVQLHRENPFTAKKRYSFITPVGLVSAFPAEEVSTAGRSTLSLKLLTCRKEVFQISITYSDVDVEILKIYFPVEAAGKSILSGQPHGKILTYNR